jgi:pimeloyl-ACP methyl ester carboxylesterase
MARAWFWFLDYVYVSRVQLRHFFARAVPERYGHGDRAPILLLPGVYETWQFLRPIADRLNAAGHPVHIVRELGYNRSSIPDAAALAQRFIDDLGLERVVLLAHSKGGLIGKHMMLLDDRGSRVDRLVAIATPFGGSIYARYFPNPAIRAFAPKEPTLVMLAANAAANSRVTSIFGDWDPHIPAGSRLEGATNVLVPVSGHFRLLADERVHRAVDAALGVD